MGLGSTNALWQAGSEAVWDYLDMRFEVTRGQLLAGGDVDVVVSG